LYVQVNRLPSVPPRPKNQGCHGVTVAMHGIPFASHWSLTGFEVSGVEETSIRWMPLFWIRSAATSAARFESDWLSRFRTSTG
jgi:hypothetical protein